jgi:hypothetical protein
VPGAMSVVGFDDDPVAERHSGSRRCATRSRSQGVWRCARCAE